MHNFKELLVWQKSMELVKDVYLLTKKFPKDELFGLTQQIRRAVVSIPSNIAEGAGRTTDVEFSRFIDIALGSTYEVETQLYISLDLEYIFNDDFKNVIEKIQSIEKMIYNLKKSYQKSTTKYQQQQPATNDQQPSTNDQKPSTNDQRPTTNDQQPSTNDQQPSTNDQRLTTNDQILNTKNNKEHENNSMYKTSAKHYGDKNKSGNGNSHSRRRGKHYESR